jgi:hypothetical protein
MRLALPPQLIPTKIGNVIRRSPGRRETAPRMRGIVTAKGTANVKRREKGSATVKIARRAEAGARGPPAGENRPVTGRGGQHLERGGCQENGGQTRHPQ